MSLLLPSLVALTFAQQVPVYRQAGAPVEARIKDLVGRMTLEEKARQLDMYQGAHLVDKRVDDTHASDDAQINEAEITKQLGNLGAGSIHDLYPSARVSNAIQKWVMSHNRLGIPVLFIEEALHGYQGLGQTIFPHSINLASTFDTETAEATGAAIASEARSHGIGYLLCPVLDVAREPRWGRIEEDFGEDAFLTGMLGAAYVKGMQGDHLDSDHNTVSEPKHFAGHGSPEGGLNTNSVHAGEREIRSVMLRSFEPAFRRSKAMGAMAAYHEIDGVPCAGNPWLLTTVLRGEWGFQGFVLSDLGAINELYSRHQVAATEADAVRLAISSGVDMQFYDFNHDTFQNALIDGVRKHLMPQRVLDQAVSRVLRVKFELGLFDHPFMDENLSARVVRSTAHLDLSLKSARESICLLKNDDHLLPIDNHLKKVAVIGPNATTARLGDYAVAPAKAPESIVQAFARMMPSTEVVSDDGKNIEDAVEKARSADVIVVGLGERDGISGEGSDRSNLGLPDNQEALLERLSALGHPVILVLENGRPLSLPWALEHVPAIVEAWYPGEFGSQAVVETLLGLNAPAGRLPISFPRSVGAIPDYYNPNRSKMGKYVDGPAGALLAFGHGLTYTTFEYSPPTAEVSHNQVKVQFTLTNTGKVESDEVPQLYVGKDYASVETPAKTLKAFARVHLKPGESKQITFTLGEFELEIWGAAKKWSVEPGAYTLWVGPSSKEGKEAHFNLPT